MATKSNPEDALLTSVREAAVPFTILGAGGFIGKRLTNYLSRHGVGHEAPPRDDLSHLERRLGHVVYCIGLTADYAQRPFDTVEAHSCRVARTLAHARFESFVYLSSTRLYDSGTTSGREDSPLSLRPLDRRNLYDLSKALGESLCVHAGGGRARVARLASVYSDDLGDETFLHSTLRRAARESSFSLDTAADNERDYVHIDDVCASLVAVAAFGKRPIYNVASGENVNNSALFETVARANGCRIHATRPPTGARFPVIDVSAVAEDFGLHPRPLLGEIARILAANGVASAGASGR
jgi:nucleoside-diphosphate-sugar epimerase